LEGSSIGMILIGFRLLVKSAIVKKFELMAKER